MTIADDGRPGKRKRAVNLSLDGDLLEWAKAEGINLSQLLEAHLRGVLRERREQAWREENRDAIREYNEHAAARGSFGDHVRRF